MAIQKEFWDFSDHKQGKFTRLKHIGYRFRIFHKKSCKSLKRIVLSRVFSEDYDSQQFEKIFSPHGSFINLWNNILLGACLVSLFVDPLFFYLPGTQEVAYTSTSKPLKVVLTISYLQATTARLEEWRIKRNDAERWMQHRQLPAELRQCFRRYNEYKWLATQGVDEQAVLGSLPLGLRREIKRHLCHNLVRRVPLFDEMDERMLEAICERLRPVLYTSGTYLFREVDPVEEMSFIIRGLFNSHTTGVGRTGLLESCHLAPGDFCGEELLSWALVSRTVQSTLPSSTRMVRAVTDVEAFVVGMHDLHFVATQFPMLHRKQLQQKFRFYSHQWRTWAACFIQATSQEGCHLDEREGSVF